jgi:hypothetical protein
MCDKYVVGKGKSDAEKKKS